MLSVMLPSAVAASTATGTPIVLCSGDVLHIVYDLDGSPVPKDDAEYASLECAAALFSAFAAVDGTSPDLSEPIVAIAYLQSELKPSSRLTGPEYSVVPPATGPPLL